MPKEELAAWVGQFAMPDSQDHHRLIATIQVRCVSDIEKALRNLELSQDRNAQASEQLGKRIFWLSVPLLQF